MPNPPTPDPQDSGGPVPPAPTLPPKQPRTATGRFRASRTQTLERRALIARVVELRTANVPVAVIAKSMGLSESTVKKYVAEHFRENADWATAGTLLRKYERERQLEQMDAQVMRAVMIDPGVLMGTTAPPATGVPTISFKDWLAAVETSRRLKAQLIDLHGLNGVTAVAEKNGERPGDPVYENRVIRQFLEGLKVALPDVYPQVVKMFDEQEKAAAPDLPLPGGTPLTEDDGDDQAP